MGASLEQALHTTDTSRHMKKHLPSLVIKEMHVRTTVKASRYRQNSWSPRAGGGGAPRPQVGRSLVPCLWEEERGGRAVSFGGSGRDRARVCAHILLARIESLATSSPKGNWAVRFLVGWPCARSGPVIPDHRREGEGGQFAGSGTSPREW